MVMSLSPQHTSWWLVRNLDTAEIKQYIVGNGLNIWRHQWPLLLTWYQKFKMKSLPVFFDNIFMRNSDIHPYGTRRRDQLHFFSYKTAGASKCLRHSIPNLLNDIDLDTRRKLDTLSLDGFSSYYKSLVINGYDPFCYVTNCYICNRR